MTREAAARLRMLQRRRGPSHARADLTNQFNTRLLLMFLAIGTLFGKEGPADLVNTDFQAAYLIGSVALGIIMFEAGLKTKRSMLSTTL